MSSRSTRAVRTGAARVRRVTRRAAHRSNSIVGRTSWVSLPELGGRHGQPAHATRSLVQSTAAPGDSDLHPPLPIRRGPHAQLAAVRGAVGVLCLRAARSRLELCRLQLGDAVGDSAAARLARVGRQLKNHGLLLTSGGQPLRESADHREDLGLHGAKLCGRRQDIDAEDDEATRKHPGHLLRVFEYPI